MTDSLITLAAKALAEMYEPHERWEDWMPEGEVVVGAVLAALRSQVEALILTFDYDMAGYQKAIDDVLAVLAVVENDQVEEEL